MKKIFVLRITSGDCAYSESDRTDIFCSRRAADRRFKEATRGVSTRYICLYEAEPDAHDEYQETQCLATWNFETRRVKR